MGLAEAAGILVRPERRLIGCVLVGEHEQDTVARLGRSRVDRGNPALADARFDDEADGGRAFVPVVGGVGGLTGYLGGTVDPVEGLADPLPAVLLVHAAISRLLSERSRNAATIVRFVSRS